jgi:hypothetical protein
VQGEHAYKDSDNGGRGGCTAADISKAFTTFMVIPAVYLSRAYTSRQLNLTTTAGIVLCRNRSRKHRRAHWQNHEPSRIMVQGTPSAVQDG